MLIFLAGVLLGVGIKNQLPSFLCKKPVAREIRSGGYHYTNPLLDCETGKETIGDQEIKPFKSKLQAVINKEIKGGFASFVSVYFRDLNNGPWFGINEAEKFSPASLLKVPVMLAYYKAAETSPSILTKRIIFSKGIKDNNVSAFYRPSVTLEEGKSYTTEELIYRMIVSSDNNAKNLLIADMNIQALVQPYMEIGVSMPGNMGDEDFMSVQEYASFFRVLFNATYLNREMSEKALEVLSNAEFSKGIAGGLPSGLPAAHKFGERTIKGENISLSVSRQLHDCGIVYYPENPYLLCVMTRGNDFEAMAQTIRNISVFVFNEVDEHEGRHGH